jgi:hypothetical protein
VSRSRIDESEEVRMKKVLFLLLLSVTLIAPAVYAQSATDAIEVTRSDIQADRKAIVAANLDLTEAEGTAFWPVYNTYRADIVKAADRVIKVVMDYAAAYKSNAMTDAQASALVKEWVSARADKVKVLASYQKKFEKVLSPKKVARFYQVENRLDLIVEAAAASEIPLVK